MTYLLLDARLRARVLRAMSPSTRFSLLLARARESRELVRIDRYLSRDLKFADVVVQMQNETMTGALQQSYGFGHE